MTYGAVPPNILPPQNNELAIIIMQRWLRAATPHRKWADEAKVCQDFVEGRQLTDEQKAELARLGRPIIQLNKVAPLVRLVSGYQRNNRTDMNYLPGNDGRSSEETADIITALVKAENNRNLIEFQDSDVFMDGITTGRGFFDYRLDFSENDLGEQKITHADPFSVYVDPDCDTYDLSNASYLHVSKWVSVDEVACTYGKAAAAELKHRVNYGSNANNGYLGDLDEEISPIRKFAMAQNEYQLSGRDLYYTEFIDTYQKRIRLVDAQYYVSAMTRCFVDLDTGDKKEIPEDWDDMKIQKCLFYAESLGNHLMVANRMMKRLRWTVLCGDIVVHDQWSPYRKYTLIPFFPYFRRGVTRGIVNDLLDPQREINKRRMSITEILSRNSNSGWSYHENSLDPVQEENLKMYGAKPGVNVKWKGTNASFQPKRIEPGNFPVGLDKLEQNNRNDLLQISGINESALGELENVQSGRAIEARQRQSVIALQMYLDNFSRTKRLQGEKSLELIQDHYTEPRMFKVLGEDGSQVTKFINQKTNDPNTPSMMARLNDVTVGKYQVKIDETPMSATFQNAQFEESMNMLQKLGPVGAMLIQLRPDLLVSMSSIPRKEEWEQALKEAVAAMQQQQAAQAAGGVAPPPQGGAPGAGVGQPAPAPGGGGAPQQGMI